MKESAEKRAILPLVYIFEEPDGVSCQISRLETYDHRYYGLIICDLARHVAKAFDVDEADVWEWVERERIKPTTKITGGLVRPQR